MRIAIDISQTAYLNTGVSSYLLSLIEHLVTLDTTNEYILFFSSLRKKLPLQIKQLAKSHQNVAIEQYKIPQSVLSIMWNTFHIVPVEYFVGNVEIFISSDWTEPPVKSAKKITILYDLIVKQYPQEMDKSIVVTQNKKLQWVKKESTKIICISKATMDDAIELLGIQKEKLVVIYPGL